MAAKKETESDGEDTKMNVAGHEDPEEYHHKLGEMQKYIPFLETMIQRLERSNEKAREAQLIKMKSLYAILAKNKKRLKIETLKRCEDVLRKLMLKVDKNKHSHVKTEKDVPEPPSNNRGADGSNSSSMKGSVVENLAVSDGSVSSTTQSVDVEPTVTTIMKSLKLAAARTNLRNLDCPNESSLSQSQDTKGCLEESQVTSSGNHSETENDKMQRHRNVLEQSRERLKKLMGQQNSPAHSTNQDSNQDHSRSPLMDWQYQKDQPWESLASPVSTESDSVEDDILFRKVVGAELERSKAMINKTQFMSKCDSNIARNDSMFKSLHITDSEANACIKPKHELSSSPEKQKFLIKQEAENKPSFYTNCGAKVSPGEKCTDVVVKEEKTDERIVSKSVRQKLEKEITKVHRVGVSTGGALRALVNKDERTKVSPKGKGESIGKSGSDSEKSPGCRKLEVQDKRLSKETGDINSSRPVDPRRRLSLDRSPSPVRSVKCVSPRSGDPIKTMYADLSPTRNKTFSTGVKPSMNSPGISSPVDQTKKDPSGILAGMSCEELQRIVTENLRNLPSPPPITKEILETVKSSTPVSSNQNWKPFNAPIKEPLLPNPVEFHQQGFVPHRDDIYNHPMQHQHNQHPNMPNHIQDSRLVPTGERRTLIPNQPGFDNRYGSSKAHGYMGSVDPRVQISRHEDRGNYPTDPRITVQRSPLLESPSDFMRQNSGGSHPQNSGGSHPMTQNAFHKQSGGGQKQGAPYAAATRCYGVFSQSTEVFNYQHGFQQYPQNQSPVSPNVPQSSPHQWPLHNNSPTQQSPVRPQYMSAYQPPRPEHQPDPRHTPTYPATRPAGFTALQSSRPGAGNFCSGSGNSNFHSISGNANSRQTVPGVRLPGGPTNTLSTTGPPRNNLSERDPRRRSLDEERKPRSDPRRPSYNLNRSLDRRGDVNERRRDADSNDRRRESNVGDWRRDSSSDSVDRRREKRDSSDRGRDRERGREKERESEPRKPSEDQNENMKKTSPIISPLNSLYGVANIPRTGKGYGFQHFRIPKIKREPPVRSKSPPLSSGISKQEQEANDSESTEDREFICKDDRSVEGDKTDQNKENTTVDKKDERNNSKDESDETSPPKTKEEVTQELIESLIRKSFESGEAKKLFEQAKFLEKLSENLKVKKFRKIRRILESDSDDSDDINKTVEKKVEDDIKKVEENVIDCKQPKCDVIECVEPLVPRIKEKQGEQDLVGEKQVEKNMRKTYTCNEEKDGDDDIAGSENKEIKPTKKANKRRSALELLQDDIREMFISEGVVTATGYRMCRLLKEAQPGMTLEEISRSEARRMQDEAGEESDCSSMMSKKRVDIDRADEKTKKGKGKTKGKKKPNSDVNDTEEQTKQQNKRKKLAKGWVLEEYSDEHEECKESRETAMRRRGKMNKMSFAEDSDSNSGYEDDDNKQCDVSVVRTGRRGRPRKIPPLKTSPEIEEPYKRRRVPRLILEKADISKLVCKRTGDSSDESVEECLNNFTVDAFHMENKLAKKKKVGGTCRGVARRGRRGGCNTRAGPRKNEEKLKMNYMEEEDNVPIRFKKIRDRQRIKVRVRRNLHDIIKSLCSDIPDCTLNELFRLNEEPTIEMSEVKDNCDLTVSEVESTVGAEETKGSKIKAVIESATEYEVNNTQDVPKDDADIVSFASEKSFPIKLSLIRKPMGQRKTKKKRTKWQLGIIKKKIISKQKLNSTDSSFTEKFINEEANNEFTEEEFAKIPGGGANTEDTRQNFATKGKCDLKEVVEGKILHENTTAEESKGVYEQNITEAASSAKEKVTEIGEVTLAEENKDVAKVVADTKEWESSNKVEADTIGVDGEMTRVIQKNEEETKVRNTEEFSNDSVAEKTVGMNNMTPDILNVENKSTEDEIVEIDDDKISKFVPLEEQELCNKDYVYDCSVRNIHCLLCSYSGKAIVAHYKQIHPDSEVFIARLPCDEACRAITESEENQYDSQNLIMDTSQVGKRKKASEFVCRFCDHKSCFAAHFYEHVCAHTGEYRYQCCICPYVAATRTTFKGHFYNHHSQHKLKQGLNLKVLAEGPSNSVMKLFGYICSLCNFSQLLRVNVEKHVALRHPNVAVKIICINMSKPTEQSLDASKVIDLDTLADDSINDLVEEGESEDSPRELTNVERSNLQCNPSTERKERTEQTQPAKEVPMEAFMCVSEEKNDSENNASGHRESVLQQITEKMLNAKTTSVEKPDGDIIVSKLKKIFHESRKENEVEICAKSKEGNLKDFSVADIEEKSGDNSAEPQKDGGNTSDHAEEGVQGLLDSAKKDTKEVINDFDDVEVFDEPKDDCDVPVLIDLTDSQDDIVSESLIDKKRAIEATQALLESSREKKLKGAARRIAELTSDAVKLSPPKANSEEYGDRRVTRSFSKTEEDGYEGGMDELDSDYGSDLDNSYSVFEITDDEVESDEEVEILSIISHVNELTPGGGISTFSHKVLQDLANYLTKPKLEFKPDLEDESSLDDTKEETEVVVLEDGGPLATSIFKTQSFKLKGPSSVSSLKIGCLGVRRYRDDNTLLYSCLIPGCIFACTKPNLLEKHLSSSHHCKWWNGVCQTCNVNVLSVESLFLDSENEPRYPLTAALNHLLIAHLEPIKVPCITGKPNEDGSLPSQPNATGTTLTSEDSSEKLSETDGTEISPMQVDTTEVLPAQKDCTGKASVVSNIPDASPEVDTTMQTNTTETLSMEIDESTTKPESSDTASESLSRECDGVGQNIAPSTEPRKYIRIRRLSGDKLSEPKVPEDRNVLAAPAQQTLEEPGFVDGLNTGIVDDDANDCPFLKIESVVSLNPSALGSADIEDPFQSLNSTQNSNGCLSKTPLNKSMEEKGSQPSQSTHASLMLSSTGGVSTSTNVMSLLPSKTPPGFSPTKGRAVRFIPLSPGVTLPSTITILPAVKNIVATSKIPQPLMSLAQIIRPSTKTAHAKDVNNPKLQRRNNTWGGKLVTGKGKTTYMTIVQRSENVSVLKSSPTKVKESVSVVQDGSSPKMMETEASQDVSLTKVPENSASGNVNDASMSIIRRPFPVLSLNLPAAAKKKLGTKSCRAFEYSKAAKLQRVFQLMLNPEKLRHLYKCMARHCSYTTDVGSNFEQHCQKHVELHRRLEWNRKHGNSDTSKIPVDTSSPLDEVNNGAIVKKTRCRRSIAAYKQQCAYCCSLHDNPTILLEHIRREHGHCRYQCSYCFFRAMSQSYVVLHQNTNHTNLHVKVLLCHILENVPARVDVLPDRGTIVPAYVCHQGSCGSTFYNPKAFLHHEETEHINLTCYYCHICFSHSFKPDKLLMHYKLHSCCLYQCRYCIHGTDTKEEMQHHLCNFHENLSAVVLVRRSDPNSPGASDDWTEAGVDSLKEIAVDDVESMPADGLINPPTPPPILETENEISLCDFWKDFEAFAEENPHIDTSDEGLFSSALPDDSTADDDALSLDDDTCDSTSVSNTLEQNTPQPENSGENVVQPSLPDSEEGKKNDDDILILEVNNSKRKTSESDIIVLDSSPRHQKSRSGDSEVVLIDSDSDSMSQLSPQKRFRSEEYNEEKKLEANFEPLVTLKHRNPRTKALIDSAIDPLETAIPSNEATESNPTTDITMEDNLSLTPHANLLFATPQNKKLPAVQHPNIEFIKARIRVLLKEAEIVVEKPSLFDDENSSESINEESEVGDGESTKPTAEPELDESSITIITDVQKPASEQEAVLEDVVTQEELMSTGLSGEQLYRCGNATCTYAAPDVSLLRDHLLICDLSRDSTALICVHCQRQFKQINSLLEHLRVHGIWRYGCSLCTFRASVPQQVAKHLKQSHRIVNTRIVPVDARKTDPEIAMFVVCPKDKLKGKGKIGTDPQNKRTFSPEEIDSLPRKWIVQHWLGCGACSYRTKVMNNLRRHLRLHNSTELDEADVPTTESVNPVPCLEKKEMMFDKMTNLAASSHASGRMGGVKPQAAMSPDNSGGTWAEANLPKFVPEHERYVCGAPGCSYLTCDETMLRYHLRALHFDETAYRCPHCPDSLQPDNSGQAISIDRLGAHLKMHDSRLYKCAHCPYNHFQRHVVERHLSDKHPEKRPFVHVVREPEGEASALPKVDSAPGGFDHPTSSGVVQPTRHPWRCGLCKFRCITRAEVLEHTSAVHGIKSQFKCGLCTYRSSSRSNFDMHFAARHPGSELEMINVYQRVEEPVSSQIKTVGIESLSGDGTHMSVLKPFDTTPIWRRDMYRIRHIRGILIETEEETRRHLLKRDAELLQEEPGAIKKQKIKSDEAEEERDILENKYGPYGKPVCGNMFFCTICNKYKTKFKSDMREHLYRELNYVKWVCTHCRLMSCSRNHLQKHSAKVHDRNFKPEAIAALTPDHEIEEWVDKLLTTQHQLMKGIIETPVAPAPSSVENSSMKVPTYQKPTTPGPSSVQLDSESEEEVTVCGEVSVQSGVKRKSIRTEEEKDMFLAPPQKKALASLSDDEEVVVGNINETTINDSNPPSEDDDESFTAESKTKGAGLFKCKDCSSRFQVVRGLKLHIRLVHLKLGGYSCGYCDRPAYSELAIKQHCRAQHSDQPMFIKHYKEGSAVKLDDAFWEHEYGIKPSSKIDEQDSVKRRRKQILKSSTTSPSITHSDLAGQASPSISAKLNLTSELLDDVTDIGRKCMHCDYRCKSSSDLRNHEMRHWVQKPFKCCYCEFEGVREYEVKKHSAKAHPNKKLQVVERPFPYKPDIKPLRWTKKQNTVHEATEASDGSSSQNVTPEKNALTETATTDNLDLNIKIKEEEVESESNTVSSKIFRCFYCPLRTSTLSVVHQHWQKVHKRRGASPHGLPFRYKEVSLDDLARGKEKRLRKKLSYMCAHCKCRGTMESIKKHHEDEHPDKIFKADQIMLTTKYTCSECSFSACYLGTVRRHFGAEHKGKEFQYMVHTAKSGLPEETFTDNSSNLLECTNEERVPSPDPSQQLDDTGLFQCLWCNETCETDDKIQFHHAMYHSHLTPNYISEKPEKMQKENSSKMYRCPKCSFSANLFQNVYEHLRRHAKPYKCSYCSIRFSFPTKVRAHSSIAHPNVPANVLEDKEAEMEMKTLKAQIITLVNDIDNPPNYSGLPQQDHPRVVVKKTVGSFARKSTSLSSQAACIARHKYHAVARKSTNPLPQMSVKYNQLKKDLPDCDASSITSSESESVTPMEEYSFYGTKPSYEDMGHITTVINYAGAKVNVNVITLSQIVNLKPEVKLVDLKHQMRRGALF